MSNTKNTHREKKGLFSGLTIAFAIAVVFLFIVGGTVAYFFASTNNIVNTFVPGEVACKVNEDFDEIDTKKSITVENTGTTTAYMRLCLTTYWVENYEDNGVKKTRVVGRDADMPEFNLGADWVLGFDGYYYYTKPVPPEENDKTGNLLDSNMILDVDGNFSQVVEVFAEAIQSAPDQAVLDAWGSNSGGAVTGVSNGVLTVNTGA